MIDGPNYTQQAQEALDAYGTMRYIISVDEDCAYFADWNLFEDEDGELVIVVHTMQDSPHNLDQVSEEVFQAYEGIDGAVDYIDMVADMVVEEAYEIEDFHLDNLTIEEMEEVCERWKRDVSSALEAARTDRGE